MSPEVRARHALLNVLPRSAAVEARGEDDARADLVVAGQPLRIHWAGEGNLGDVRKLAARRKSRPDIIVARRLSAASRQLLSEAGIGWVDETGAAEIAVGTLVVSRTGRPQPADGLKGWTPAVQAVAEALLCGVRATVSATEEATGLSTGSCTAALRFLTDEGLLVADAERGRSSARRVEDPDRLLGAYTRAARAEPSGPRLQVGLLGKDLLDELAATGRIWNRNGVVWAATGAAAASVTAPFLTSVSSVEVYVDADTLAGLEAIATRADLRIIEGGRLTLRPFPTASVRSLADEVEGLRVAPWPRVYVDLQAEGVRGEEAADHLRRSCMPHWSDPHDRSLNNLGGPPMTRVPQQTLAWISGGQPGLADRRLDRCGGVFGVADARAPTGLSEFRWPLHGQPAGSLRRGNRL